MNIPRITWQQIQEKDKKVINKIWSERIMTVVATRTVDFIKYTLGYSDFHKIVIIASKGNNWGDAILTASFLCAQGYQTKLFLLCSEDNLWEDTKNNLEVYKNLGWEIIDLLEDGDLIIDWIFGTGLTSSPKAESAEYIQKINNMEANVLSLDIPSGLDATTGEVFCPCVKANWSITFHIPKEWLFSDKAKEVVGQLWSVESGLTFIEFPELQADLNEFYSESNIVRIY